MQHSISATLHFHHKVLLTLAAEISFSVWEPFMPTTPFRVLYEVQQVLHGWNGKPNVTPCYWIVSK